MSEVLFENIGLKLVRVVDLYSACIRKVYEWARWIYARKEMVSACGRGGAREKEMFSISFIW